MSEENKKPSGVGFFKDGKESKERRQGLWMVQDDGGCRLATELSPSDLTDELRDKLRLMHPNMAPPDEGYFIGGREQLKRDLRILQEHAGIVDPLLSGSVAPPDDEVDAPNDDAEPASNAEERSNTRCILS